jgi:hypothetical protein
MPVAIVALAAWAFLLAVTGGVDLRPAGIRFSSRDPFRPALVAYLLAVAWAVTHRAQAMAGLSSIAAATTRVARLLALLLALVLLGLGLRYGTYTASAADASGYLSQADRWLAGDLVVEQPFTREMPWSAADWTFAPLGYVPAVSGGAIVPSYPPGLPMLMAVAKLAAGDCGPFLVVPLLGALTVWLTYLLGERVGSPNVGLAAALLMATSPAFVFMILLPMCDAAVAAPFAAAVLLALARTPAAAVWAGLAVSFGLLIRPNLAPLAAIMGVWIWFTAEGTRERWSRAAAFAAGVAPSVVAVPILHTYLYGAPWNSGYGEVSRLYAWQYLLPNLSRYPRWLVENQPLAVAALLPALTWRRVPPDTRAFLTLLGVFVAGVWLCYLFYFVFEPWWFLRFLLPAFPMMLVLAVVGLKLVVSRLRWELGAIVVTGLVVAGASYQVGRVQDHLVLGLWKGEAVYATAARFVSQHLPANAVIISILHSGSLRYYTGRLTFRYDWLEATWWPAALDVLTARGFRPFVLLADEEEADFRRRFALVNAPEGIGQLVAELDDPSRIRLYDPLTPADPTKTPARMPFTWPCPCPWLRTARAQE